MITQQESDIAIQAIEPSQLVVFSHDTLQKMYEQDLFWQQLGRLAAENEFITAECHNRFLRDLTATERYKQILRNEELKKRCWEVLQHFLSAHIASCWPISIATWLGVTTIVGTITSLIEDVQMGLIVVGVVL